MESVSRAIFFQCRMVSSESAPPWTRWWQDDLPCHFQPEQALANADYLTDALGKRFVENPAGRRARHILVDLWHTEGGGAFLSLNALAEDLRTVEDASGLESLVRDLRSAKDCLPAWHAIHAAALLGRPDGCRVTKFFPQTEDRLPDFLVDSEGQTIAVEAKLLTRSALDLAFEDHFKDFAGSVVDELRASGRMHVIVLVVVKSADSLPDTTDVLAVIRRALSVFQGSTLKAETNNFNVFLETMEPFENGPPFADFACDVVCPKSEKEDLRVLARGKEASKQLGASAAIDYPGLLVIGINKFQDQRFLAGRFRQTFESGRLSGISSALLLSQGNQLRDPVRAPLDLVAAIDNPTTSRPIPNIAFRPVGVLGHLIRDTPEPVGLPCYRVANYQLTVREGINPRLVVPDYRPLTAELLT